MSKKADLLNNRIKPQVADRSLSRFINQEAIVEKIYNSNGISKAQIAKELGISKPAVASNVENLLSLRLIEERGEGEADRKGGRKPVMLYFNKLCRYAGALDLAYTQPVCAVADLEYNIVGLKKIRTRPDAGPEERKLAVLNTFLDILNANNVSLDLLDIIVISQPGIIKEEIDQYYSQEQHHVWTQIGLKEYLREQLNVRVSIQNDVNLAAIGELNFDDDEQLENLIYVSCGVGIGAGIIINKQLYAGESNAAGEIGSLLMSTGQRFEDHIAMEGLVRRIQTRLEERGEWGNKELTFSDVADMARNNQETVSRLIYEAGKELGRAFYNCCISFDIGTVIFGGEYLELGDKLFEGMEEAVKTGDVFRPRIRKSGLRQIAGIFGCFVVGREKIIERLLNS